MKRLAALGLVFVLMFSFTGCKGDIELNKEDNDHVAEYIAGVLLKYSYENEWEYQKLKNSALTNYQNSVSGSTQTSSGNTKANSGSKIQLRHREVYHRQVLRVHRSLVWVLWNSLHLH